MSWKLTTFGSQGEFEKARRILREQGAEFKEISPAPGYSFVAGAALAMPVESRYAMAPHEDEFVCCGWVDYYPAEIAVPGEPPPDYAEDVFGLAAVMVLAPCVADPHRFRLIAHISGDMSGAFPFMNALMDTAAFNPKGPTLTFMDRYRLVSLYPNRIAASKVDDLVDGWRVLEYVRRMANEAWARRGEIEPSWEVRRKPPILEILKRLPRTNCGQCGEMTCMAFAAKVYGGLDAARSCAPVFQGEYGHLKDALEEVCRGLGEGQLPDLDGGG